MSHAEGDFLRVPARLKLTPEGEGSDRVPGLIQLPISGQGTIAFAIAEKRPFTVVVASDGWGDPAFRWMVDFGKVSLWERADGEWYHVFEVAGIGLDPEPRCPYWFSVDYTNRLLRYGKGEMRLGCMLGQHELGDRPTTGDDPFVWLRDARFVEVSAAVRGSVDVWRDPVTVEVPMKVVPHDAITMVQMAEGEVTVPGNLTPTCRVLYDNVAGAAFTLDTPDFPAFAAAIRESILDEDGWCNAKLKEKADEFGNPDPDKTYLRITLGQNQGDSPGVPFVMEIWPAGHYSPIHNHGGAEAVIKVLHGAIDVDLYRMLSPFHEEPFTTATFARGDVAWISQRLNQVHKLVNRAGDGEPCITIQCYLYADTNTTHWRYFDYLADAKIAYFDPNSDCDFLAFRDLMKAEWDARHARKLAVRR